MSLDEELADLLESNPRAFLERHETRLAEIRSSLADLLRQLERSSAREPDDNLLDFLIAVIRQNSYRPRAAIAANGIIHPCDNGSPEGRGVTPGAAGEDRSTSRSLLSGLPPVHSAPLGEVLDLIPELQRANEFVSFLGCAHDELDGLSVLDWLREGRDPERVFEFARRYRTWLDAGAKLGVLTSRSRIWFKN